MRAATAAATTAATAAAGLGEFIGGGHAAQFKGHADVFADLLLEFFQLFAGDEEIAGDLVVEKRLTRRFELADLGGAKLDAGVLFLMQLLAALVHTLILKAGGVIVEKAFDVFLKFEKHRIAGDLGAQFTGFGDDGGIFGNNGHARCIAPDSGAGNGHFVKKPPNLRIGPFPVIPLSTAPSPMPDRISTTFENLRAAGQKAFVAYIAAGDPDFDTSLEIMKTLADLGADIIELGLPFSDPLADGIVNQMAADRALKSGMTTPRVLELIRRFRASHETPIVLFTYLNPVFTYGFEAFHHDAAAAGADGILLLDLPPDEAALNTDLAIGAGLKHIRLIAPTTPQERVKLLAQVSEGFIYALSRTGVTGAHGAPSQNIAQIVSSIKQHTDVPVCVGFGISTPEQAAMVADAADGVIVGSAIVKQVELHPETAAQAVRDFTAPLIAAVKASRRP